MTWEPAETIALLDELDELVRKASSVPATDQARLDPQTIDALLDRLRKTVDGQPGLTAAAGDLEAYFRSAKSIPLTNDVRVEREGFYELLDGMRAACGTAIRDSSTAALPAEAAAALEDFDDFVLNARKVPFTAQVRLDPTKAYALVERLRAALGNPSAEAASALAELDKLLHGAKPIPLTTEVRVGLVEIYELLDLIRG